MFTVMIRPEDYKYLLYASKYYNAELLPPQDNLSDYIFCAIKCKPGQMFCIGRLFERMRIEAKNFNGEEEE